MIHVRVGDGSPPRKAIRDQRNLTLDTGGYPPPPPSYLNLFLGEGGGCQRRLRLFCLYETHDFVATLQLARWSNGCTTIVRCSGRLLGAIEGLWRHGSVRGSAAWSFGFSAVQPSTHLTNLANGYEEDSK